MSFNVILYCLSKESMFYDGELNIKFGMDYKLTVVQWGRDACSHRSVMSGSMENVRLLVLGEVTRRRVTIYSVRTLPQKRSVRLKFRWRINFKDGHDSAL